MIKQVEMYTVVCDGCGKDVCKGADYAAWSDRDSALDVALESGWETSEDGQYCPDCHFYNDDDELVFKTKTKE